MIIKAVIIFLIIVIPIAYIWDKTKSILLMLNGLVMVGVGGIIIVASSVQHTQLIAMAEVVGMLFVVGGIISIGFASVISEIRKLNKKKIDDEDTSSN